MGGIITLGGASAVFTRWLSPIKAMKQKIENKADRAEIEALSKKVETLERFQDTDHDRIKEIERGNEKICKCILAITDHELTGNSIDKLRKAKEEMQDYLIEK